MILHSFQSNFAHLIQDNLYECDIDAIDSLSDYSIKRFGIHSTGIQSADEQLAGGKLRVLINIPTILDYYLNVVDVEIIHEEEKYDICRIISGYLDEWEVNLKQSLNLRIGPYKEFLENLRELAAVIYDSLENKVIIKEEIQEEEDNNFFIRPIDFFGDQTPQFERQEYSNRWDNLFDLVLDKNDRERY